MKKFVTSMNYDTENGPSAYWNGTKEWTYAVSGDRFKRQEVVNATPETIVSDGINFELGRI